jgi:hypothetical protein
MSKLVFIVIEKLLGVVFKRNSENHKPAVLGETQKPGLQEKPVLENTGNNFSTM